MIENDYNPGDLMAFKNDIAGLKGLITLIVVIFSILIYLLILLDIKKLFSVVKYRNYIIGGGVLILTIFLFTYFGLTRWINGYLTNGEISLAVSVVAVIVSLIGQFSK